MSNKTPRSDAYLAFLRTQSCKGMCRYQEPNETNIEAAHVRLSNGGGMGLKPSDYRAVPLCHHCHAWQHKVGERTFWAEVGIDPDIVIIALLGKWCAQLGKSKAAIAAIEEVLGEL